MPSLLLCPPPGKRRIQHVNHLISFFANFERIFKTFEQVDGSLNRRYEGTGLGLASAKRLVEHHGGKIWVESEGQGCTFCFIPPGYPPERKRMELPACNLPICG